ncbi:MAG: DUF2057 domain-containing protein [Candidatus Macondimonas sp.]
MLQHLPKFMIAFALFMLAACANPKLRLYDGTKQSVAQVATLTLPEQIEVARLNGVEVKGASGLWTRGDKVLELAPGRYEVLAYYREIWNFGDQHDVLRSDPVLFVLDAQAGKRYRIDYQRPASYQDAQRLAAAFSGTLIDEVNGARTPSKASGVRFPTGVIAQVSGSSELLPDNGGGRAGDSQVVAPLDAPDRPPTATAARPRTGVVAPLATTETATPVRRDDWLELMQAWWKQAGPEERRAFLRWVGEQPN